METEAASAEVGHPAGGRPGPFFAAHLPGFGTLRTRLTLLTVTTLLLSLLGFAGLAGGLLWRAELGSITRQVYAQTEALLAVARSHPASLGVTATDILEEKGIAASGRIYQGGQLRWKGGAAGPEVLDRSFFAGQGNGARTLRRVGDLLVVSGREGEYAVQVGRSLEPLESLLQRYAAVALLSLLALSLLAGWVVARQVGRALAPLEVLAQRVRELDSPEPIPALHEPGEVGALARALQGSLEALRAERQRETFFLASASHELRTPVTAMLADVQHTLSRPRQPEELRDTLARTERTASRLRLLTGNLMTLTRLQSLSEPRASWAEVDLLHLAGEAVDLLQPLGLAREVELWLDGQEAWVRGDVTLLASVAENLIGNAIKFTPAGGEVRVQVLPLEAGGAELVVEDSGPGFPPGTLTDAFVRGQTDTEGFGLGLAVVKQVVDAHGGTLTLGRGQPGGARVVVRLP